MLNIEENFHPKWLILIKLAEMQPKGCSIFYKLLRANELLINTTAPLEQVWHTVLHTTLSVTFWDKCWRSLAHLTSVDFKIRWVQLQINRHILPTNYSKYKPDVSQLCSFYAQINETIYHLFWQHDKLQTLWEHLKNILVQKILYWLSLKRGQFLAIFSLQLITGKTSYWSSLGILFGDKNLARKY